jgi:hypothetical protein
VQSVTDGAGRLVTRVVVTRLLVVGVGTAVVATALVSLAVGLGLRSLSFGISLAGLALVVTAFTLRASLGTGWSNGRRFGDQAAARRLRRAVRRGSVDGLTGDDRRVVVEYALGYRDVILVDAVQNAGLGLSIGMNQVSRLSDDGSVDGSAVVLLIAGTGLVVAAVVTALVQDRRRRRFLATLESVDSVDRTPTPE